jgi:hypothetical protein
MLVGVIIVFVLSQLPLLVLNAWYAIDPEGSYESLKFHTLNSIGVLLIVLNTSTNFLLYCFFGQKFRQTAIEFILNICPNHSKSFHQEKRNFKQKKLALQKQQGTLKTSSSTETNDSKMIKIKAYDFEQQTLIEPSSPFDEIPFSILKEETNLLLPSTSSYINDSNEQEKSELDFKKYSFEDETRVLASEI